MKRKVFDAYATAIAKEFHLELDQMFSPRQTERYCRRKTNVVLFMYGKTY